MSNKLIALQQLQQYKTYADLKYQDKLMAGSDISIVNKIISAKPTLVTSDDLNITGSVPTTSGTITKIAEVTLQPGIYAFIYTCSFTANATGYRQCGFSNGQWIDGLGIAYADFQGAVNGDITITRVEGLIEVSASSYPDGRTFNLLASQNSGSTLNVTPALYYLKF